MAVRRAVLVPLLAAGCAFAFVFALLPRPSSADDFALRVLLRLDRLRIAGSVIHLRGETVVARCTALHDRRELISLARGTRIVVRETRVHLRREPRVPLSAMPPSLFAAEADLAGPRLLYIHELIAREAARAAGVRRFGSTYVLRLSGAGPQVNLVVSKRTLRPVAVEYRSRLL